MLKSQPLTALIPTFWLSRKPGSNIGLLSPFIQKIGITITLTHRVSSEAPHHLPIHNLFHKIIMD